MHKFDLISGAPKTFIFERKSNKTNLGGFFTIVFIVIIIMIMNGYLYEFFANPKFRFTYAYDDFYYQDEELEQVYNNRTLYPELTFHFELKSENIKKNIKILTHEGETIHIGDQYNYTKNVSDLNFAIYYKCENKTNCALRKSDEDGVKYYSYIHLYNLRFVFLGYYCDHQNPYEPIKREEDYEDFPFTVTDNIDYYLFSWKIFKYVELSSVSGMFRSRKEHYGGEILKPLKYFYPSEAFPPVLMNDTDENNVTTEAYYQVVSIMQYNRDNFGYYDIYTRNKISIFDAIANICSLVMTLYGVITFIFCGFYSNSFDNYKIIEKILAKRNDSKEGIELRNKSTKSNINNNKENKEGLLDDINIYEEDKDDEDDKNKLKEMNTIKEGKNKKKFDTRLLPKFHFYHFFYNNVYTHKCCDNSSQDIISSCNEIITRYYSIDSVVYNQLRLENLFKDYKWNDPKLNSIDNNELVSKIENLTINY